MGGFHRKKQGVLQKVSLEQKEATMGSKRIILSVILGLSLVGCTSPPEKASTPPPPTAAADVPFNKYCPVDPTSPIDPKVTYMYNGKLYGFCCKDCVAEFKKNPAKYAAAAN
jgi:YHS domain-containing protein